MEYTQKGATKTAHAEAEVLLSGGAVNSPQVLLLSGIGKSDYLSQFGIKTVADIPGVGQNMQVSRPQVMVVMMIMAVSVRFVAMIVMFFEH